MLNKILIFLKLRREPVSELRKIMEAAAREIVANAEREQRKFFYELKGSILLLGACPRCGEYCSGVARFAVASVCQKCGRVYNIPQYVDAMRRFFVPPRAELLSRNTKL